MARRATDTIGPALRGRAFVKEELERRGATVLETRDGRVVFLEVVAPGSTRPVRVRVKTRQSGTWQTRVSDGTLDAPVTPIPTFWAFVDFTENLPVVFIAPDRPLRRVLHESHQAYLKRHGGKRAVNQASDHHALRAPLIEHWRGSWDLLGLSQSAHGDA